jgi:hypothetical protein
MFHSTTSQSHSTDLSSDTSQNKKKRVVPHDIGKELMGAAGGLYFTIGEIGGSSGPYLMGYIKDYTGAFLFGVVILSA